MKHETDHGEIIRFVTDARRMGLDVRTPDVNGSHVDFSIGFDADQSDEDGDVPKYIISGLQDIKGCGGKASDDIVEKRIDEPYYTIKNFYDRVTRRTVNRGVIKSLVMAGAFKSIYWNTKALLHEVTINKPRGKVTKPVWEWMLELEETRGAVLYTKVAHRIEMTEEDEVGIMAGVCPIPPYKHKIEYYNAVRDAVSMPITPCNLIDYESDQIAIIGIIVDIKYNNVGDFHKDEPDEAEKKRIGWGKRYANINIDDGTAIVRVNIDTNAFPTFRHIIDKGLGTPVLMYGRAFFKSETLFCDVLSNADTIRDAIHQHSDGFIDHIDPVDRIFFRHPITIVEKIGKRSIKNIIDKAPAGTYPVTALVMRVKIHWTKKGTRMAFVDVEDETSRANLIIWPEELDKSIKKVIPGHIINLYVRKDNKGLYAESKRKIEIAGVAWETIREK
jgi:DNA polymerase III alpha subunit